MMCLAMFYNWYFSSLNSFSTYSFCLVLMDANDSAFASISDRYERQEEKKIQEISEKVSSITNDGNGLKLWNSISLYRNRTTYWYFYMSTINAEVLAQIVSIQRRNEKTSTICLEIIVFQKTRKVFKENNPRSELKVLANIAKILMLPFLRLLLLVYIEIKNIQTMGMSSFWYKWIWHNRRCYRWSASFAGNYEI